MNPLIWVITIVTLLITPLITTHEPPSRGSGLRLRVSGFGFRGEGVSGSGFIRARGFASVQRFGLQGLVPDIFRWVVTVIGGLQKVCIPYRSLIELYTLNSPPVVPLI